MEPIGIDQIRDAASEVFTPEGVDVWVNLPNRFLDGKTPREMVDGGRGEEVLDLIDLLASGAAT